VINWFRNRNLSAAKYPDLSTIFEIHPNSRLATWNPALSGLESGAELRRNFNHYSSYGLA
jgi:hypothetical protein